MPLRSRQPSRPKTFALVLGGGGARGLAHIPIIEALDEMGVRPAVIVGSSIGAAVGAAYASGMSGREMRRYALHLLHDRGEVLRRLMLARAAGLAELLSVGLRNPMLLDAQKLADQFLPDPVRDNFDELDVPLLVIATDLYGRSEALFADGPLRPAVAASMAIPGLVRPVEIGGRVLVDGAAVNPLPFDRVRDRADIVVAVDASIGASEPRGIPDPWEALFSTIQLMGQAIVAEKLQHAQRPDIVVRPNVGTFRLLDFFAASAILRAGDGAKAELKEKLAALLA